MGEQHFKCRGRLRLILVGRGGRRRRSMVGLDEQIRAAAERYEADIRAAGARYDAALNRIVGRPDLSRLRKTINSVALDGENTLMARPSAQTVVREDPAVLGHDQDEEE